MGKEDEPYPQTVLRLVFSPTDRLGRGKIELLRHIKETGSISAAGRRMDMSYRRAWLLVSEVNAMFDRAAVDAQRGGQKGGGAVLTAFGEELIACFERLQHKLRHAGEGELAWLVAHRRSAVEGGGLDDGKDGPAGAEREALGGKGGDS